MTSVKHMESVFCHIRGTHADAASSYGPLVRLVGSETEIQRDRETKRERERERVREREKGLGGLEGERKS